MKTVRGVMLGIVLLINGIVFAQDAVCPIFVREALDLVDQRCDGTDRNQACYGYANIEAEPQEDVTILQFESPGDIEDLALIKALQTSALAVPDEWGVALLRVQANLPNSLPGQNVTILLFGNVRIEDARTPEDEAARPMQAFYFQTGVGESPCLEAPQDGILVQTPEGAGRIELTVNNAVIDLGSTAFLQAGPEAQMRVAVLEGDGIITTDESTVDIPAGQQALLDLDEDGLAFGPVAVEPYDPEEFKALPIQVLPREIVIESNGSSPAVSPLEFGSYNGTVTGGSVSCPGQPTFEIPLQAAAASGRDLGISDWIIAPSDQADIAFLMYEAIAMRDNGDGSFSGSFSMMDQSFEFLITPTSGTSAEMSYTASAEGCTIVFTATIQKAGGR